MSNTIKLHPELRRVGAFLKIFSLPVGEKASRFMYKMTSSMRGKHGDGLKYEQLFIPAGEGEVRVCVYSPLEARHSAPILIWIHGGGFSVGAPEQDEKAYIKRFIDWGAGAVVAPDYTKSVVKPYPAALYDCYAALKWAKDNCATHGARDDQIFIGGDSAGGGLTAALSLYARDMGEVSIAFQMPLYPMIDDRPTKSNTGNKAPLWNSKANALGWKMYLGRLYGTADVPVYAAPARAEDYAGLPPTCTFVGDIEPFYDETVSYVENLRKCGVDVRFKVFEGCFHAFDMVSPKTSVAKEASQLLKDSFKYACANYYAAQTVSPI